MVTNYYSSASHGAVRVFSNGISRKECVNCLRLLTDGAQSVRPWHAGEYTEAAVRGVT